MKTLYLECRMGAAGDMLMGALLELHPNQKEFLERLNALNIPGVKIEAVKTSKCGIVGTGINVTINGIEEESIDSEDHHNHQHSHQHVHQHSHDVSHHHSHTGMHEITHIIEKLNVLPEVRDDIISVYRLIADAESRVHGKKVDEIHFHEVGTMDAVADITGVCMLINELAPDVIVSSPVCTGYGQVKCAHGILPVPAPATAYILHGVPSCGGSIEGELCTPTGAALIKHFAKKFGSMPVMKTEAIGYGMGKKDFSAANCVRAIIGEY